MHTEIRNTPRLPSLRHQIGALGLVAALALAALAVPCQVQAQIDLPSGPPYTEVSPTISYSGLAIGDMNGDGNNDVVIAASLLNTIQVVPGDGQGGFGPPQSVATGVQPRSIVLGDFSGNGKLDVVAVTNGALSVHLSDGAGNLGVPVAYSVGEYVNKIATGDINGDGRPDLIVVSNSQAGYTPTGRAWVLLNSGAGSFSVPAAAVWARSMGYGDTPGAHVAAVDVDGDGNCDIVVTSSTATGNHNYAGVVATVLFGNGAGAFPASIGLTMPLVTINAVTGRARQLNGLAVADLDGDGQTDLIVCASDFGTTLGPGSVTVFRHTGARTFDIGATYLNQVGRGSDVVAGDLDNDGSPDLVVAGGANGGGIAYHLNDGLGGLGVAVNVPGTNGIAALTVGDLTNSGAGTSDIVIANYGTTKLLRNGPPGAVGELFFSDALTGSSPNLNVPAKYTPTAGGLQRTQSDNDTDRPVVATKLSTYLAENDFVAEVSVNVVNNDLLYFGVGQGDTDTGYNNEPSNAFLFRVHNNFTNGGGGYYGIQAAVRKSPGLFLANGSVGNYGPGSTITLRIVRSGDSVTMSIVGGGSVTYSLAAYPSMGLTNSNTRVFFGNTTVGSVFSNLNLYQVPPDTTPPVITAPADITAEATGSDGAVVTFTASAEDDVDGSVAVIADPESGSLFGLGTTIVDLGASDAALNVATATFNVTVEDTTPPVITAPADITAEATSAAGAVVIFTATAVDIVDGSVAVMADPESGSTFAVGTTDVGLGATDAAGNEAYGSFNVAVVDTTAPVISSVTPSIDTLSPPNHKMVPITITVDASDLVGITSLKIISATSNEPDNGPGDGNTVNDVVITGDLTVDLRAERAGGGSGRIYTITVEATDAAGNSFTSTCTVSVPKKGKSVKSDKSKKSDKSSESDKSDKSGKGKKSEKSDEGKKSVKGKKG